jgi:hypothetical protein
MNFKEYFKQRLNEGVPLGPTRFADRVRKFGGSPAEQRSAAISRASRLRSLQRLGTRKADGVVRKLGEKIPGLEDAHLETQLSGNFGDFESDSGAVTDALNYIRIAHMIANHPEGGHKHATRYLHGASMYQLGLATEYGGRAPESDPYLSRNFEDLPGANIEREEREDMMYSPTKFGKESGDHALRLMSAARKIQHAFRPPNMP